MNILKKDKEGLVKRITEMEQTLESEIAHIQSAIVTQEMIDSNYNMLLRQSEQFIKELQLREQKQIEEEKEVTDV